MPHYTVTKSKGGHPKYLDCAKVLTTNFIFYWKILLNIIVDYYEKVLRYKVNILHFTFLTSSLSCYMQRLQQS
jgi:hypothetical protein